MTAQAWLSLGANIGDPPAQLAQAIAHIAAHPEIKVVRRSSMLVTKPWGKTDQPDFANMAIEIRTTLQPLALLDVLLGIELSMGRVRDMVWGPRLIDIDIIAYDRLELSAPRLKLPHPHAQDRDFVLDPLREIAPDVADWLLSRH
jgi:2-amino-4-hydroxy-6-hydroxymethyldihydropteridine diphosphokinase